jgi:hypothetical protein
MEAQQESQQHPSSLARPQCTNSGQHRGTGGQSIVDNDNQASLNIRSRA